MGYLKQHDIEVLLRRKKNMSTFLLFITLNFVVRALFVF